MRKIFIITIFFFGSFFLFYFLFFQFRFGNIYFDRDYESAIPPCEGKRLEAQAILSQTFTYLDRGHQSFVFRSEDGQYVLKFFDAGRLKSSLFQWCSKKKRRLKYQRLFEGYEAAYLRDQDNTGVLYAKLHADPFFERIVLCIDRFGVHHAINLKKVPFIIQKAAVPTRILISELLDQNEVEKVKGYFRKIVGMYVDEYQKGLYDGDRNFMHNTGFVKDVPLRMDAGRLMFSEHFKQVDVSKDLKKIVLRRAKKWLQRHYPEHSQEIVSDIQNTLSTLF